MSLRDQLRDYLSRKLEAKEPQTWIDGGGNTDDNHFVGQKRERENLEKWEQIYKDGGPIAQMIDARAFMIFGVGTTFESPTDIQTQIDGEDITLTEWLEDQFSNRDQLFPEIARDCYIYGDSEAEMVPTRAGEFSGVDLINPKTMTPKYDDKGVIQRWEQTVKIGRDEVTQTLSNEEVAHFVLSKVGRQIGGVSLIGRGQDEIERYAQNQESRAKYLHRYGHPRRHVKVGREGGAAIDDIQLKKVRSRVRQLDDDDDMVTGVDVDVNSIDENQSADITDSTETDLKQLAIAMGIPLELADIGGDGMGTGKPAELRLMTFERQGNAEQEMLGRQFIDEVVRPVLEQYSPFPSDVELRLEWDEIITDKSDKANWMSTAKDVLTVDEIRAEFGYDSFEGDENELGPPQDSEEDQGLFGGLSRAQLIEGQTESGTLYTEGLGYADKADAEAKAEELGCSGAHKMERGDQTVWVPCSSHESFEANKPTFTRTQSEVDTSDLDALLDIHESVAWEENNDRQLFAFDDEDVPEFAKNWIRQSIQMGAVFDNIETIPASAADTLRQTLMDSLEEQHGWSINSLTNNIQEEIPSLAQDEAERIARTETQSIVANAREIGYEERGMDDAQYRWVGPSDQRTTEACEWIKEQSEGGVPMTELKELVDDAQDRFDTGANREWTPHVNCRHTFVRSTGRNNKALADDIPKGNNKFAGGDIVMFGWESGEPTTGRIVRSDSESITLGETTVTGEPDEFVHLIELENGALIAKPESEVRKADGESETTTQGVE